MYRKINIGVGPPLKRAIDGIIYCQEERVLGKWINLMKAVARHKRIHRRFLRQQRRKRRLEFEYWLGIQRDEELRERLQQIKYGF